MQTLRLDRTGTFSPKGFTINLCCRCGSPDMDVFQYQVNLWGDSRYLDSNGFLVDNGDINQWFQDYFGDGNGNVLPSCEGMVLLSLKGLRQMLNSSKYHCCIRRLRVTVGGSNGAFISGEWKAPNWMPAWMLGLESKLANLRLW